MEPAPVDPTDESPQVRDNPARHRFEILLGDQVAGYLTYVERDGRLVFEHTVIADELEGRGLGSAQARRVLHDQRPFRRYPPSTRVTVPVVDSIAGASA